jgi:hypothetical protein
MYLFTCIISINLLSRACEMIVCLGMQRFVY